MTEYQKVVQGAGVVRSATKRPQPRAGLALHDAAQQGVERLSGEMHIGINSEKPLVYAARGRRSVRESGFDHLAFYRGIVATLERDGM